MKNMDVQEKEGNEIGESENKNGNDSISERKSRKRSKSRGRSASTRSRSLSVSYRSRSLSRQSSFSRRSSSIDMYGKKDSKHSKDIYNLANYTFDSKTSRKSVNIRNILKTISKYIWKIINIDKFLYKNLYIASFWIRFKKDKIKHSKSKLYNKNYNYMI